MNTVHTIQMVDLKGQYQKIKAEVDQAVLEVVASTQYINGPAVRRFSEDLAAYLDVGHVIPCGNGTDALQIALMALGLEPGDEVITCPFTFVATAEVIALLNLKPVFVDVNPDTFTMDAHELEKAITAKTKAIIPVHLFGQAANMEAIMKVAAKHDLFVVEDNAQAIGADFIYPDGRRKKLGTIAHIGCTSFFPSKNLGAYGDGGAMFTNDKALAEKLKVLVNHGMTTRYYHDEIGVNSRLDSVQAAVLNVKLKYLDAYNKARQKAADRYDALFKGLPGVTVPKRAAYSSHVFHQYTLRVARSRDAIAEKFQSENIPFGIYYPVPLHLQKAYKHYGYNSGDFPVSENLAEKVISLPMHTELEPDQQQFIAEVFKRALKTN